MLEYPEPHFQLEFPYLLEKHLLLPPIKLFPNFIFNKLRDLLFGFANETRQPQIGPITSSIKNTQN